LLLLLQVLELLKTNFVLPADVFQDLSLARDVLLSDDQLVLNDLVLLLLYRESLLLLLRLLQGSLHLFVLFFLVGPLSLLGRVLLPRFLQVSFQLLDHVEVRVRDVLVVRLDVVVLLLDHLHELLDRLVLLVLDALDLAFALLVHFLSQQQHFVFVLQLDFVCYAFVFVALVCHLLVTLSVHRIQVLALSYFLLVAGNYQRSEVLLQFSLINSMLIFDILKRYLCLLFKFS